MKLFKSNNMEIITDCQQQYFHLICPVYFGLNVSVNSKLDNTDNLYVHTSFVHVCNMILSTAMFVKIVVWYCIQHL